MASVIQLARHRSVSRRDLPLELSAGDSDLRPIALLLWIGSAIRVVFAFAHHETFDVEATLALLCLIGLPLLMTQRRFGGDTARQ